MKQALSLVLMTFLALISCKESLDVKNFDFLVKVQTPSGTVTNVNQPLSFSLRFSELDQELSEELDIQFSLDNGTGIISNNDVIYESGEGFVHNALESPILKLHYVPNTSGMHKLKFDISNRKVKKKVSLDINVADMVITATIGNIPQTTMIDKRFSFDLNISGDNFSDLGECVLTATISKGSGEVYKEDVIISSQGKSSIVKSGRNPITYLAKEAGENIISFNIASEYGYTQNLLVPIEIVKPEFTVISSIDQDEIPVIPAAQDYSFKLNIADVFSHEGMILSTKYRFVSNTGTLSINSKEVKPGADIEFKVGDNVIMFNGADAGIVNIEFIITNQYGVQKTENVKFDVGGGSISLDVRQIHQEVDLLDQTPIELTIVRPGYSGEFELSVTAIKGSGYIQFNKSEYSVSSGWILKLSNKETILFRPDRAEDAELEIIVRDSKGETVSQPLLLTYKVNNPPIRLNVKGYKENILINEQSNFTFSLSKKNYSGKFKYLVTQLPNSCGEILVEGQKVNSSLSYVTNPTNMLVGFTPTSYPSDGKVDLNFSFTDEYNTVKDTVISFNIITPEINVSFDTERKEYPIGVPVDFICRVESDNHGDQPFTVSLKSRNIPNVTWNGVRMSGFDRMRAYNNQDNIIGLEAVAKGENTMTFIITDKYGKSVEKDITVVGKGINTVSFGDTQKDNLFINPAVAMLKLSSNDPDNKYSLSYIVNSGNVHLKAYGNTINQGQNVSVHSGSSDISLPVEIISNEISQQVDLDMIITDAYGIKRVHNYKVDFTNVINLSVGAETENKLIKVTLNSDFPVQSDKNITVRVNQHYTYPNSTRPLFKDFIITFPKGETSVTNYFDYLSPYGTSVIGFIRDIQNPTDSNGITYK